MYIECIRKIKKSINLGQTKRVGYSHVSCRRSVSILFETPIFSGFEDDKILEVLGLCGVE